MVLYKMYINHSKSEWKYYDLKWCYEDIMFGRVTHTLDPAAMQVRSLFYPIHIL